MTLFDTPAEPADSANPGRVLVVDPDPLMRSMLTAVLAEYGFAALSAPNAADARALLARLDRLGHARPGALLVHPLSPLHDPTVWDELCELRAAARAPIIMLTADTRLTEDEVASRGFAGPVVMPFDVEQVIRPLLSLMALPCSDGDRSWVRPVGQNAEAVLA